MKQWLIVVVATGLIILVAVFLIYLWIGGFALEASGRNEEWGFFGESFGGIGGTLLTFLSTVLIVFTINEQHEQIHEAKKESHKHDILRCLDKVDADLKDLLRRPLLVEERRHVELGDVVFGIEPSANYSPKPFASALGRLLKLTTHYCQSLALYRQTVNDHSAFQAHLANAWEMGGYLEKHRPALDPTAGKALETCKSYLGREPQPGQE